MKNKNVSKRVLFGMGLGLLAGLLCFMGFSSNPNMPAEMAKWQEWSFGNAMMWSTIFNRFAIGVVVGIAGFLTVHPLFGFKLPVFLRGACIGVLLSLSMAFGALLSEGETACQAFWLILIAGLFIGMVIDLIITKIAGQGSALNK
jgi:hypothetical protein